MLLKILLLKYNANITGLKSGVHAQHSTHEPMVVDINNYESTSMGKTRRICLIDGSQGAGLIFHVVIFNHFFD